MLSLHITLWFSMFLFSLWRHFWPQFYVLLLEVTANASIPPFLEKIQLCILTSPLSSLVQPIHTYVSMMAPYQGQIINDKPIHPFESMRGPYQVPIKKDKPIQPFNVNEGPPYQGQCGGTCGVCPAGGVWAGWEGTGSAGGIGSDCGHLLAIRPIRECVFMCLLCL